MIPVLTATLSLLAVGLAGAQPDDDDRKQELLERRQKKLASEFLEKAAWTTDLVEAKKRAAAENEVIFAYITRSYEP